MYLVEGTTCSQCGNGGIRESDSARSIFDNESADEFERMNE